MQNKDNKQKIEKASDLMPTDDASIKILKKRALMLSKSEVKEKATIEEVNYIKFRLGEKEYYGIPYEFTKEVIENVFMTNIPSKYDYVIGAINRRSGLIAVIDIRKFLQIKSDDVLEKKHIIVTSDGQLTVGIAVDELMGSSKYEIGKLETSIYENTVNLDYIIGLDCTKTTIINAKNILTSLSSAREI